MNTSSYQSLYTAFQAAKKTIGKEPQLLMLRISGSELCPDGSPLGKPMSDTLHTPFGGKVGHTCNK